MILNDENILNEVVKLVRRNNELISSVFCHPLDADIIRKIEDLKEHPDLYKRYDDVYVLWVELVEKAIKCLRYHDEREPFQDNATKEPVVHGMDKLADYFKRYSDFEGLLYGADKYYRDHVFHVFRTWATGVYVLLTNDMAMLNKIETDGKAAIDLGISGPELISMWTVAALCHDLGYPLEKARNVLSKTKEMTQSIIGDSEIWSDLSFSGIQDEINKLILRFISSKMLIDAKVSTPEQYCKMRVQPKYYIKLCKSLEKHAHGVLSSIVLSKSLVYFLESEFGVNEDYYFKQEDHKQFYVKRDILRAIAFHTCPDVYHMSAASLPFLLILCDEVQNWDRRCWNDHYEGIESKVIIEIDEITSDSITVTESFGKISAKKVPDIVLMAKKQFEKLKVILRDGIETFKRNFDFKKVIHVNIGNGTIELVMDIPKDSSAKLLLHASGFADSTLDSPIVSGIKKFSECEKIEEGKYRIC
jgi:hypothetical protein